MRHEWVRASLRGAVAAGLVVVALAGCRSIVISGEGITSYASRSVSPTSVVVGGISRPAIRIRLDDCHTLVLRGAAPDGGDLSLHARPYAHVTDANGLVLHSDYSDASRFLRPGTTVVDGGPDPHLTTIPVNGGKLPLTISSGCTAYPGHGSSGLSFRWVFPPCTTGNRTCQATPPGTGYFVF